MSIDDVTPEGERVRRFQTLELSRNRAASLSLGWTAIHPITPSSPLHGLDIDTLAARRADVILIITGIDETFAQTVHARANYPWGYSRFGERFVDVLREDPTRGRVIDYTVFHQTVPVDE